MAKRKIGNGEGMKRKKERECVRGRRGKRNKRIEKGEKGLKENRGGEGKIKNKERGMEKEI